MSAALILKITIVLSLILAYYDAYGKWVTTYHEHYKFLTDKDSDVKDFLVKFST